MSSPCLHLPWDTELFGLACARVVGGAMDEAKCRSIIDWCRGEKVGLLYYLADDDDVTSWATAMAAGSRMVDIRVELVLDHSWSWCPAPEPTPGTMLREATDGDLEALLPIAASVHTDSRFFADPEIPREKAAEMFSWWLRRSVGDGFADVVFVAELEGKAVSYITAKITDGVGTIGLVGVGSEARGQGIGLAMVRRVLEWFAEAGVQKVSVVTQGRNVAAQRVYQRCGFLTASIRFWYHKWLR